MMDRLGLRGGDGLSADLAGCDALLIAGPTASGKSALAVSIAKATGGVVINADSMQIYDGLRILTARPSAAEEADVEHQLYGVVDPRITFSAGDYGRLVTPLLERLRAEKRLAVIVGGTGLYFNALTRGLVDMPVVSHETIAKVAMMSAAGDNLHGWLRAHDPAMALRLSPTDAPRLQRAAAVLLETGESLAIWQGRATAPLLAEGCWRGLFLAPDRAALYARIDARFHAMLAAGAMEEVRRIRALALPANRGIMKAHGMPHLMRHLEGGLSLEEAIRLGQQDTRNYAKRQFTWARRFMADWRWIEA
jgi:tRNA dimethylallyltransferase